MTNREWLLNKMQNMSDKELANAISIPKKMGEEYCNRSNCFGRRCVDCKVEWLKQEYKEKITLTEAERIILENIDKDYKWICRDRGGLLVVFNQKPTKDDFNRWQPIKGAEWDYMSFFHHLFQFITWEDEEPYNIEKLLK